MPLPSYTYSGAVYSSPAVGTVYFNLTTSGGAAIGFLDPSHIRVFTTLDGGATLVERFRPAQWEFNMALTQVKLSVATVANEAVIVRRITPIAGPLIDVPDGINLPAQRLREVNLYNLYVTQEQYEANAAALALATDANTQVGLVLANVANQLPYTLYANRAAVPTNPGSAVSGEVLDSTLMQTFTPLTGVPSGFVGSSSLIVRIRYNVSLATWQWIDYRAANADSRYLLKTQLVNSAVSSSTVDPPTAAAVKVAYDKAGTAQTGVDTLAAQVGAIQSSIASQYAIVGNVASIPVGTNGLRVDITNSTGIESFAPLAGRPSGFVGSTSLSVRLVYSALANTWQWVDYRAVDPDGRYTGVNFTQPGTGAVGRSVTSKLSDIVSVKDFGAVGDGTTSDVAAFTAAVASTAASIVGVYVPPGNYRLSTSPSIGSKTVTWFFAQGALTTNGSGDIGAALPGSVVSNSVYWQPWAAGGNQVLGGPYGYMGATSLTTAYPAHGRLGFSSLGNPTANAGGATIGFSSGMINQTPSGTAASSTWNFYGSTVAASASSNATTQCIELDIAAMAGSTDKTHGLVIATGGEIADPATYNPTRTFKSIDVALQISTNTDARYANNNFSNGILITKEAIDPTLNNAIYLARALSMRWYNSGNSFVGQISCSAETAAQAAWIDIGQYGITFLTLSGSGLFQVTNSATGATTNYLAVEPGIASGSAPALSAKGNDANVDLTISPKGTGKINVVTTAYSGTVGSLSGYLPIKVNGTLFKIPCYNP